MGKTMRFSVIYGVLTFAMLAVVSAQNVRIDYRYNIENADNQNYLNWAFGREVTRERFDAASGSSLAKTTYGLDSVRWDTPDTRKTTMPVGLRGLLLFPGAPRGIAEADDLTVVADGRTVVIRYVHRGVAYELVTDRSGKLDLLSGAKIARGIAENIGGEFVLKTEYVKAGGNPKDMSSLDWSKITLVPDLRDPEATRWYEGKLDVAFRNNVLTIKGTIAEKK